MPRQTSSRGNDASAADIRRRVKRAELTSGTGALILGIGLGALVPRTVGAYAVPILVVGILLHGWGMLDKHRLEGRQAIERVWWVELLYWLCWASLFILVAYILVGRLGSGG